MRDGPAREGTWEPESTKEVVALMRTGGETSYSSGGRHGQAKRAFSNSNPALPLGYDLARLSCRRRAFWACGRSSPEPHGASTQSASASASSGAPQVRVYNYKQLAQTVILLP